MVLSAMSRYRKTLIRKGIYFADMNTALKERPELVESYFMTKAVPVDWNKFDALHGAFWQGGYLLHVPKGVVLEVPLRVFVALSEAGRTDLSHTLIIADEGSQSHGFGGTPFGGYGYTGIALRVRSKFFVADNAHVNYVGVQRWNLRVWNFFDTTGRLLEETHSCVGCRVHWGAA